MPKIVNRTEFLKSPDVAEFIQWLTANVNTLIIDLDIKKSRFVPGGVHEKLVGMNNVLPHYIWRSEATPKGNWQETRMYLGELAGTLQLALGRDGGDDAAMAACRRILSWGGDRNPKVGASPFLNELHTNKELSAYLRSARSAFNLDSAITDAAQPPATRMNSMLTKVHALASDDGLPIYDSRVAAAIAALVELWRRDNGLQGEDLPKELCFPATLASRTVHDLRSDAKAPGVMSYAPAKTDETARKWSSAKIRLAWVLAQVLKTADTLFVAETSEKAADRMHAFEAALFIIGYDVKCLTRNCASAGVDAAQRRKLKTTARTSLEQEQCGLSKKSISTLTGKEKNLHYAGDVEMGITGIWSETHFAFERDFLQELLGNFQGRTDVNLGADINGLGADGTLGHWINNNHPGLSPKYASAIAAVLVNEGLATCVLHPRPIKLNFL